MSVVDVNSLLGEVSAESPMGENLEYHSAFVDLEQDARGKPPQYQGKTVTKQAEPPDWRSVRNQSIELLALSKDLRVGIYLTRALANTDGFSGLGDGLALIRGLLERYWDSVHPQMDPTDNNDPTARVTTISTLSDRGALLNTLLQTPLVSSRALGRFGLRAIHIAKGETPPTAEEGAATTDVATIDAAFMDADVDELQATADALTRCNGDLAAIDALLMDKVGSAQAPDLGALASLLKEARSVLDDQLARRGVGDNPAAGVPEAAQTGPQAARSQAISGEIRSREDAVRMMDKISEYFQRNEPSSPIPLLMQRAKRLVSKDFMGILRDLAPAGVSQAESVGGVGDEG